MVFGALIDAQVYLCLLYGYFFFLHMDLVLKGGGRLVTMTTEMSAWGLGRRLKFGAVTEYCSVGGVSCLFKMRTRNNSCIDEYGADIGAGYESHLYYWEMI